MKTIALIILLLHAHVAIAQITDSEGNEWPSQVDLSSTFALDTPIQIGGTCHIYSEASLIENACYRATGKKIGISRQYLIERHLLVGLREAGVSCLNYHRNGIIDDIDGASAGTTPTIDRIFERTGCTDSQFPMKRGILDSVHNMVNSIQENVELQKMLAQREADAEQKALRPLQKQYQEKAKIYSDDARNLGSVSPYLKNSPQVMKLRFYLSQESKRLVGKIHSIDRQNEESRKQKLSKVERQAEIDKQRRYREIIDVLANDIKSRAPATIGKGTHIYAPVTDPDLSKCLDRIDELRNLDSPTTDDMMNLLASNIPFTCEGNFDFGTNSGQHETTVIGYRFNERYKSKIEFLLRDSNSQRPSWGWDLHCDAIHYIRMKH